MEDFEKDLLELVHSTNTRELAEEAMNVILSCLEENNILLEDLLNN